MEQLGMFPFSRSGHSLNFVILIRYSRHQGAETSQKEVMFLAAKFWSMDVSLSHVNNFWVMSLNGRCSIPFLLFSLAGVQTQRRAIFDCVGKGNS